jgi:ABC-type transporter Mla subunit MlaD
MLLRAPEESVERILTTIGAAVVVCIVCVGFVIVSNPFSGLPLDRISVTIDSPYVGQGVTQGTALVMHGVKVGEVTQVASLPGGGVRLATDLQKGPAAGLTNAMNVDFRPINYFGVTGINVIGHPGGQVLRDGMRVHTLPQGNFTLQALLSRLGEVSAGALTPQLISVIDRTARYTDALNPLVETVMITLSAVADVQKVPTARLLANATGISAAFPSYVDSIGDFFDHFIGARDSTPFGEMSEDFWKNTVYESVRLGPSAVFGSFGRIEVKFVADLLPAVDAVKSLMDPVPALLRPDDFAQKMVQLRTRLEKAFTGPSDQRALQVRIVLDRLPGVAGPLAAMGGAR